MLFSNIFYNKYAKDVYSQNGEDGIIHELLTRLNISHGWVCEFGAWDGINLSNTFNLVKSNNFNAIYIEGDTVKYKDLLNTAQHYKNITPVCAYVDKNENSLYSLDNILKNTAIPTDFDILSIDIDSYDYHVWKSVKKYNPKIVIIEINSSVQPNNDKYIHSPGIYEGTGFYPMYKLGIEKGYTLLLHTGNMIFIRNDLYNKVNITYENPL